MRVTVTARRRIIAFIVLVVCLAVAVTLNFSWIILHWRQGVLLFFGTDLLSGNHRRADTEHRDFWCAKSGATSNTTVSSTP